MSESLGRLSDLVKRVEMRVNRDKVAKTIETSAASIRRLDEEVREAGGMAFLRRIEQDQNDLTQMVRKVATMRHHMDAETLRNVDAEIRNVEADINNRRARAASVQQMVESLQVELVGWARLRQQYTDTKLFEGYDDVDELLAELELPLNDQIKLLYREVNDGSKVYGSLSSGERFFQLKLWAAMNRRLRHLVELRKREVNPEVLELMGEIFPILKWMSTEYQPGYVECMGLGWDVAQTEFGTWDAYIDHCRKGLEQARRAASPRRPLIPVGASEED